MRESFMKLVSGSQSLIYSCVITESRFLACKAVGTKPRSHISTCRPLGPHLMTACVTVHCCEPTAVRLRNKRPKCQGHLASRSKAGIQNQFFPVLDPVLFPSAILSLLYDKMSTVFHFL